MPLLLRLVDVAFYYCPDESLTLMVAPLPDGTYLLSAAKDNPADPEGDAIDAIEPIHFADRDTALRVGSEYAIRHEGGTLADVKARTLEWVVEKMPLDVDFIPDPDPGDGYVFPVPARDYVH